MWAGRINGGRDDHVAEVQVDKKRVAFDHLLNFVTHTLTCLFALSHAHVYTMIRSIATLPLRPSFQRRLLASRFTVAHRQSRSQHAHAPLARPPSALPSYFKTQDDSHDLRQLFDHAQTSTPATSTHTTGVFGYHVKSPYELRPLTQRVIIQCQAIVDRICDSHGDPTELRRVVKNLDRLSDVLCGVIDMCELLRTVHPDPVWVEECENAYAGLCSFMNELNTHPGMYEVS
jgi:intermediate peptidase